MGAGRFASIVLQAVPKLGQGPSTNRMRIRSAHAALYNAYVLLFSYASVSQIALGQEAAASDVLKACRHLFEQKPCAVQTDTSFKALNCICSAARAVNSAGVYSAYVYGRLMTLACEKDVFPRRATHCVRISLAPLLAW